MEDKIPRSPGHTTGGVSASPKAFIVIPVVKPVSYSNRMLQLFVSEHKALRTKSTIRNRILSRINNKPEALDSDIDYVTISRNHGRD